METVGNIFAKMTLILSTVIASSAPRNVLDLLAGIWSSLTSNHNETFRWFRGQALQLQPQESSDGLLQLGSAGCQRPNQVDAPRQDVLHRAVLP